MSVFANIENLQKPKALTPIVTRAKQYIATMALLRKPVNHVVVTRQDYDKLMAPVQKSRQAHDPVIVGLRIGEVRVDRRGDPA